MTNPVLEVIRSRRSVLRFEETRIKEEKVKAILEAGRWAPSWVNKQPWSFIVVTNRNIKEQLSKVVPTVFVQGVKEAPVCIVVVVDTTEDPYHFIEDGAAASQNIILAAASLELSSCWVGLFDLKGLKDSNEAKVRDILEIPEPYRVIALLPIGHTRSDIPIPAKERKPLHEILFRNKFGER